MKKISLLFAFLILLNGCNSSDDSVQTDDQETIEINGGTVYTYQIVTIPIQNLTQEQYVGFINDIPITGFKRTTNEISFHLPGNTSLGNQILTFQGIDAEITLQIIETQLTQSPDEELTVYFDNITAFQSTLDNSEHDIIANEYLVSFNNYYNSIGNVEKTALALNYKANKELFDYILTTDFSKSFIDGDDLVILAKMLVAVGVTVYSGVIAFTSLGATPFALWITASFGAIAIITWNKFIDLQVELAERNIKVTTNVLGGIEAYLNPLQSSGLELTSGTPSSFPLESKRRPFIANDATSENTNIGSFFNSLDRVNSVVIKVNQVIERINDNSFFTNISILPLSVVNQVNPVETALENEEFFNRINFSIESDNVNIDNISFSNGNLNITTSIVDPSIVTEFVETSINFSYEDDFNRLTGSYPAKIYKENDLESILLSTSHIVIEDEDGCCFSPSGYSMLFFADSTCVFIVDVYGDWNLQGESLNFVCTEDINDRVYEFSATFNDSENRFTGTLNYYQAGSFIGNFPFVMN